MTSLQHGFLENLLMLSSDSFIAPIDISEYLRDTTKYLQYDVHPSGGMEYVCTQDGISIQFAATCKDSGKTIYPVYGYSMSATIKNRLRANNLPFFANDNISKVILPWEKPLLQAEVAKAMSGVLSSLVIDTENDHNSQETAQRVAKMYVNELYTGRYDPMPSVTAFPNAKNLDELYVVGPITVKSACSHHMVPIIGKTWVGILPGDKLPGLSKFSRICEWIMRRPQIQEEATIQIADLLESLLEPKGIAIVTVAQHHCMKIRGVEEEACNHTTSVVRGAIREVPHLKAEFMQFVAMNP